MSCRLTGTGIKLSDVELISQSIIKMLCDYQRTVRYQDTPITNQIMCSYSDWLTVFQTLTFRFLKSLNLKTPIIHLEFFNSITGNSSS